MTNDFNIQLCSIDDHVFIQGEGCASCERKRPLPYDKPLLAGQNLLPTGQSILKTDRCSVRPNPKLAQI
jgi:hypothetical protein